MPEYVPAAHDAHVAEPATEYVPERQFAQDMPWLLYLPAAHFVQAAALAKEYAPPAQLEQAEDAPVELW